MLNFILVLEIFVCIAFIIACWALLFNILKIKLILETLDEQVVSLNKQLPDIQATIKQLSLKGFIQDLILSPVSFITLFEIIGLARKKTLTKSKLLKILLK